MISISTKVRYSGESPKSTSCRPADASIHPAARLRLPARSEAGTLATSTSVQASAAALRQTEVSLGSLAEALRTKQDKILEDGHQGTRHSDDNR